MLISLIVTNDENFKEIEETSLTALGGLDWNDPNQLFWNKDRYYVIPENDLDSNPITHLKKTQGKMMNSRQRHCFTRYFGYILVVCWYYFYL